MCPCILAPIDGPAACEMIISSSCSVRCRRLIGHGQAIGKTAHFIPFAINSAMDLKNAAGLERRGHDTAVGEVLKKHQLVGKSLHIGHAFAQYTADAVIFRLD